MHRLDAVVVSATRTEIPVFDAPQSVTVISSEELMASPFERMEDIVRSVPGMYNFRHYGLQTNGIVSPLKMRGVGSNRVLILVDGVPQNDNFNNAIAWVGWGHIQKETIERIEIVRGPTSALYGSEGLGGVIHIITKKPTAERKTSVRGEAGTADAYAGYGFHSQKIRDFGFMVAGGYEESDGFYMVEDPKAYEIKRYREVGKVLGKATYDLTSSSDISLAALYYDHDMGQGREFFHNDLQLNQYWLNYSHTADSFGMKGLVYLNRSDKTAFQDTANNNYTSPFRDEKFKGTQTWGADLQGTLLNWDPAQITVGASFKEALFEYDEDYPGSTRDAGAKGKQQFISPFANLDLRFLDDSLIVCAGARYDWIETSDSANWDTVASAGKPAYSNTYDSNTEGSFSPKLGIAWHPDDKTTLRASGGKGFRAPSLFELYKVHVRGGGTYYREANPDLEPEEIWSYDVGVERFLTDSLWGRVTFYQSFATDYIGDRLTGTGTFAGGRTRYEYQLDNISEVDIYGVETELEWYARPGLTLFANYTYNISEVTEDEENADLEGNYLSNDPRHNVHFGFRYNNPKIVNISLIANYYADIYFDNENTLKESGYFTVDASVSRRFFERLTAYLNAENIFDEEYPIFRSPSAGDTIAPGVIVAGGVKFEF
ncbi:TonB-dependent receptor plug domain-containing protein [Desulfosarcina sp.]|uniref:TonB-dependent receptor plug domain-containing protein n=1 Tax=Desulfosarcina sp. TaxID=2027861 RepID=UPI003970C487